MRSVMRTVGRTCVLLSFFLGMMVGTEAQELNGKDRMALKGANELYKEGKLEEAKEAYQKGLEKAPGSYPFLFNKADVAYQQKKWGEARKSLEQSTRSTTDKKLKAQSFFNIGNTYLQEKEWGKAADAFKQALRNEPNDPDSKYNLAYAQAMMKKEGGGGKGEDNKQNKENKEEKDKEENKDNKQDNKDNNKDDNEEKRKDEQAEDKKKEEDAKKDGQSDGENKDQKDKDDDGEQKNERPQPMPSKLSEQQAENLLNALRQEEKKLQDKKGKEKGTPMKLDKDW